MNGVVPPGDNLYSTSLVALDISTGRLRWFGTFSAIDVSTGTIRWQKKVPGHLMYGGALATEGGLDAGHYGARLPGGAVAELKGP